MRVQNLSCAAVLLSMLIPTALADNALQRIPFRDEQLTNVIASIAFGGGQFVAVGDKGSIFTSSDGGRWSPQVSPDHANLWLVTYGAGHFLALDTNLNELVSADGVRWAAYAPGQLRQALLLDRRASVAFGNNRFVAVGPGGTAVSSDGLDWVAANSQPTNLFKVVFGNGIFAAVSADGKIYKSPDGSGWENPATPNGRWTDVAFGNDEFLFTDGSGNFLSSRDATIWRYYSEAYPRLMTLGYGGGDFVGITLGGFPNLAACAISSDAVFWLGANPFFPFDNFLADLHQIIFGNGQFLGLSGSASLQQRNQIVSSTNGLDWFTAGPELTTTITLPSPIACGQGRFVLFQGGETSIPDHRTTFGQISEDGARWRPVDFGADVSFAGAAYGNGYFLGVGHVNSTSTNSAICISADGDRWTSWIVNRDLIGVAAAPGKFIAVGAKGTILVSTNAMDWSTVDSPATKDLYSVAFGNGEYVIAGQQGTVLASADGESWTNINSGNRALLGVTFTKDHFTCAGSDGSVLVSTNGLDWQNLPAIPFASVLETRADSGSSRAPRWITSNRDVPPQIIYANGLYAAVGFSSRPNYVFLSTDESNWTPNLLTRRSSSSLPAASRAAFADGILLIAGTSVWMADLTAGILTGPKVNGRFQFNITGEIGRIYKVQSAADLASPRWHDVGVVTNIDVTMPFTDPNPLSGGGRYYRILLQ